MSQAAAESTAETLDSPLLARIWQSLRYYVGGIAGRIIKEPVFLWCGGIAFKVLVAGLPLSLLAFGVFGLFLRRERIMVSLSNFIQTLVPTDQTDQILELLRAYAGASNTITLIGSIALVVAGVTLFTTLRIVLERVFHKSHVGRSTLHGYLSDLRMAILCGILFLLSVGVSVVLVNLRRFGIDLLADLDGSWSWLQEGWVELISLIAYVVPLGISTALFLLLYYFTPRPHPSMSSCFVGAIFTGTGFEISKHLFALATTHFNTFTRLRNVDPSVGLNALGEVFVFVVMLVFWVYYSSVLLVIGGMITALRDERLGRLAPASKTDEGKD